MYVQVRGIPSQVECGNVRETVDFGNRLGAYPFYVSNVFTRYSTHHGQSKTHNAWIAISSLNS